jgi:hypothetical protein
MRKYGKKWRAILIVSFYFLGRQTCPPIYFLISSTMATPRNNILSNKSRREDALEFDQMLGRMEDDIRKLKIDFDIFFNGGSKRPPLEARARLEAFIKRMSDNRNLTFSQRYLMNSLVARYVSYRELWRRQLKARGLDVG